jgi:hypothetical protein
MQVRMLHIRREMTGSLQIIRIGGILKTVQLEYILWAFETGLQSLLQTSKFANKCKLETLNIIKKICY